MSDKPAVRQGTARVGLVAIAGILVALLGFLAPPASASPIPNPQARVAAIDRPASQIVGPNETILPGQHRARALSYDLHATGSFVAAEGGGALSEASQTAFDAADNADSWSVSAKHLATAGGNYAKFAAGTDPNALAAEALRSPDATFLPNPSGTPGSFIVETDLGQVVGTKEQTWLKVVVSGDGNIITAYPVNR